MLDHVEDIKYALKEAYDDEEFEVKIKEKNYKDNANNKAQENVKELTKQNPTN